MTRDGLKYWDAALDQLMVHWLEHRDAFQFCSLFFFFFLSPHFDLTHWTVWQPIAVHNRE